MVNRGERKVKMGEMGEQSFGTYNGTLYIKELVNNLLNV